MIQNIRLNVDMKVTAHRKIPLVPPDGSIARSAEKRLKSVNPRESSGFTPGRSISGLDRRVGCQVGG